MCRTGELEDEDHLILKCPVVQAAKSILDKLLNGNAKVPVKSDIAITTNHIPTTRNREADNLNTLITAVYRHNSSGK
ncbi:hypothetical protein BgiBS90_006736 [Biomphalaria glabrata]|nr:hypothetical protein BgiBS90_006736 [Biomphalaria glabrata]